MPILNATRWMPVALVLASGGCVNISAPDKPIEINLNINVTQEVVYRLDGEANRYLPAMCLVLGRQGSVG